MDAKAYNVSSDASARAANFTLGKEEVDIFASFSAEQRRLLEAYRTFAYSIGSLVIISNLIVVVSSWLILRRARKNPQGCQQRNAVGEKCKTTYILLGNVALADAIIGANVLSGVSVQHDAASQSLCVVKIGLIVSPTLVSMFSAALIAVDRYIYIVHGLHYRRWVSTTRVRLGLALTWLLAITLGFMPGTGWAGNTMDGRKCWYIAIAPPGLIALISFVGIVPIIVVCILYSIILWHALRKVSQLQDADKQTRINNPNELRINRGKSHNEIERGSHDSLSDASASNTSLSVYTITSSDDSGLSSASTSSTDPENRFQKIASKKQSVKSDKKRKDHSEPNKWRAIKVVLFTTGSFVCTWVPYFFTTMLYILCDKKTNMETCHKLEVALASPLAILGLMNSLFNPLIYAWWHPGFKTSLKKIFCQFHKACDRRVESPIKSSHS